MSVFDALIIGGGQAGLATGYYLRKHKLDFVILDEQPGPGGAWRTMWPSLTLFSPANASNLPGWPMPHFEGFPPAKHVVDYLTRYEQRYDLPVRRPVTVASVDYDAEDDAFTVRTADGATFRARSVVAATGTWTAPFVPALPGRFAGTQWHSVTYPGPDAFAGQTVAVVGGANSGAQIAAELALDDAVGDVTWYTRGAPRWMPDDVDGRVLFQRNRERMLAVARGEPDPGADTNLGDIVMVPPVLRARDAGLLQATEMFSSLDDVSAEHLIWCTGFRPALRPIRHLLDGEDVKDHVHGLILVGYGTWTGPGSATITGVAPYAKQAARDVAERLGRFNGS